jgi:uncharacterized protein YggE
MAKDSINVQATGTVVAPYDLVGFSITVSGAEKTGPEAKAQIEETSKSVIEYVNGLIKEGLAERKVVSLTIDPNMVYENHRNVHSGYKANMKVTFWTGVPNRALEIQERLTEFPQSKVESLTFAFRDPEALREQALKNAWEAVQRRWKFQTETLGASGLVNGQRAKLVSWNVDYDEFQRLSKVSAPSSDGEEGGSAKITVTLNTVWA